MPNVRTRLAQYRFLRPLRSLLFPRVSPLNPLLERIHCDMSRFAFARNAIATSKSPIPANIVRTALALADVHSPLNHPTKFPVSNAAASNAGNPTKAPYLPNL